MADGPLGLRNFGPATAMPAGTLGLAATWDPALAERVGTQIGRDARAKGEHFHPRARDEYLPLAVEWPQLRILVAKIRFSFANRRRLHRGTSEPGRFGNVKHFMGNNSEFDRHGTDSIIDERTMREIYLPIFEARSKKPTSARSWIPTISPTASTSLRTPHE